jgi:hypothetical protein
MDDTVAQTNYRIIYKGGSGFTNPLAGTWSECLRVDVATGNTGYGTVYVNINGTNWNIGAFTSIERGNGTCGVYDDYTYDYDPYGTEITSYFDSASGYTITFYCDGAGGYYETQT